MWWRWEIRFYTIHPIRNWFRKWLILKRIFCCPFWVRLIQWTRGVEDAARGCVDHSAKTVGCRYITENMKGRKRMLKNWNDCWAERRMLFFYRWKRQEYLEKRVEKNRDYCVDQEKQEKMLNFMDLVLRKNQVMNLTAITDEAEFIELHLLIHWQSCIIFQSRHWLLLLISEQVPDSRDMIIKIAKPQLEVTLWTPCVNGSFFCSECEMNWTWMEFIMVHARAEEAGRSSQWEDTFDFAVARAVSSLRFWTKFVCLWLNAAACSLQWKGRMIRRNSWKVKLSRKTGCRVFRKIVSLRLPLFRSEAQSASLQKDNAYAKQYPEAWRK